MTLVEGLTRAKALIEHGWCQDAFAKDEVGSEVEPLHPRACQWCIAGAFMKAVPGRESDCAIIFMRAARNSHDLTWWNDRPHRTYAQVLRVFDRAIALAEKHETKESTNGH